MSRYPGAAYREVVGLDRDPGIIPVGIVLHVSGGEAESLFGYFNGPSGGIESHFHIGYTTVEQYRDTTREADANFKGNSWVAADGRRYGLISVETRGTANGQWSAWQLEQILLLARWLKQAHPESMDLGPSKGVQASGVGYHVQWGAGPNTFSWSNAAGKVCPGPGRIEQFHRTVQPALTAAPEEDMTPAQAEQLQAVYTGLLNQPGDVDPAGNKLNTMQLMVWAARQAAQGAGQIVALSATVQALAAAVTHSADIPGDLDAAAVLARVDAAVQQALSAYTLTLEKA